ncbi:MAG: DUF1893 domain-containing protein [Clostridia bacterium]|nr:DUF1893 domain-containing protein [Clostridia bacterium]
MLHASDLDMAIDLRDNHGYTLAIVRDGNILFKSKEKGILPLYLAFNTAHNYSDACAADKITGKGAAMFIKALGVTDLDTLVISQSAFDYLQASEVVVSYTKLVEYISNRTNDGKCPVETMAENSSDFDMLLYDVKRFLKKLELI